MAVSDGDCLVECEPENLPQNVFLLRLESCLEDSVRKLS